jgi:hypothetical protein
MSWFDRILEALRPSQRVTGDPPSGNGASSFHLWWDVPPTDRLVQASVVLEVTEPPQVERLYFWALQVSFTNPDGGGAHLGLQYHPRYPNNTAVNWGGYAPAHEGGLLNGSPSPLPSTPNDLNTRDLPWQPQRPYRLTIARLPEPIGDGRTAWRGEITDLVSGERTVVRDLYSAGRYLRGPVMWTEAFARCDHPSTAVRWSEARAVDEAGHVATVTRVKVNYQSHEAGGCANTDSTTEGLGWVQRTNTPRTTPDGAMLTLLPPA